MVPIFSAAAIGLGVTTALLGSWAERVGPRKVAGTASFLWAGGLVCTAVGAYTHTAFVLSWIRSRSRDGWGLDI